MAGIKRKHNGGEIVIQKKSKSKHAVPKQSSVPNAGPDLEDSDNTSQSSEGFEGIESDTEAQTEDQMEEISVPGIQSNELKGSIREKSMSQNGKGQNTGIAGQYSLWILHS